MTETIRLPETIEHVAVAALLAYPKNSRTHSADQVAAVARSIRAYGFTNPILVHGTTIIAGHGRMMAARQIGMATVPAIRLDHLTEAEARAYVIADNRLAELAGWDEAILAEELRALQGEGFDLSLTGWEGKELDDLLFEPPPAKTGADEAPPVREEAKTKAGDVWVLGKHRVMCGDSAIIGDIDRLLGGEQIDAIVTDPPYGIGIDGQKENKNKNPKHNRKAHEFMGWDAERPGAWIFNYIVGKGVPAVIWGGNYFSDLLPATRGWLYWSKGQDGLTMSDGELAWTTESTPLRAVTVNRAALQGSIHPTQKPVQVIEFSLDYIKAGEIVLDLFGGSGTTLIVCDKTGRKARLMELTPKYCDVIVRRWQNFTGQRAVHAVTGEPFGD